MDQVRVDGSRFIRSSPLVDRATLETLTVHAQDEEVTVSPLQGSGDGVAAYRRSLESFHITRVDELPARDESASEPYGLMLRIAGAEPLTAAYGAPGSEAAEDVRCLNQRNQRPFMISRSTFHGTFGGAESSASACAVSSPGRARCVPTHADIERGAATHASRQPNALTGS